MVVGARPNFLKMAPVILEAQRRGLRQFLVHTGQHYDPQLSDVFIKELGLPQPDISLNVGPGSQTMQTARIMMTFETVCLQHVPLLVVVAGDVSSTLASALVAAKLNIPVAHVEAGLRSHDHTMPEEINRVLTDHLSEVLFATERSAETNLFQEGIAPEKIHFVGNPMIDSLRNHLDRALAREPWRQYGFRPNDYGLVTFHRPSNVDNLETSREIAKALEEVGKSLPLLFPIHPRTLASAHGVWQSVAGVQTTGPLGYLDFLGLMARARIVITDSGGIQEETTALGVACVTVRHNTERPITLSEGTNCLVAPVAAKIVAAVQRPLGPGNRIPELWDGHAGERIIDVIQDWLSRRLVTR